MAGAGAEQEGGGELRTGGDADAALPGLRTFAVNADGEFVVAVFGFDAVAKFTQGLEERGLGALMHAGNAAEAIGPLPQADEGGEETGGGAGIGHEKFQRLFRSAAVRDFSAEAFDGDGAVAGFGGVGFLTNLKTKLLQALEHGLGVFAPERALQGDGAIRERGQNQRTVRDALGTGHGDFRLHRLFQRNNLYYFREHVT